jgi:hypothetical protein
MANELITGPLTEVYEVDTGDSVTVTETGSVIGAFDDGGAITNRGHTGSNMSLYVDGFVENTGEYAVGVYFSNWLEDGEVGDPGGSNLIHVRETGDVRGQVAVGVYSGEHSSIVVDGHVQGQSAGIFGYAENLSITVTGTVVSETQAGIWVEDSEMFKSSNSGSVLAEEEDGIRVFF